MGRALPEEGEAGLLDRLLNLEAKPEVEIQLGRERHQATAKAIRPSDPDYARLWKIVDENNGDRFESYQGETSRPIPVVAITPG